MTRTGMQGGTAAALAVLLACAWFGCQIGREGSDRAADGGGMLQAPEGFTIERAVPADLLSYPMFATFDDRGRLFVFESTGPNTMSTEDMLEEPPYHIRLVEDTDGDGVFDRSNIFADDVPLPMGGTFYRGSLYAAAPPDLLRLADTDGDGVADEREVVLSGWVLNHNAATLSGPFLGPDGWLYMADARRGFDITTREGHVLQGSAARIWRCRPDGSGLASVAGGGFDNAVELVFMPTGETIGTMTYFVDPQHGQRDALMHWVEGGVYPKVHPVIEADALTRTGELMPVMTKLPRVAPSGLVRYRGTAFGPAFEGNLFSAQFNTGRVMRHVIAPDGATFQTTDVPFLTATGPDVHPTDVLQDADGSLLVLDTGGWFIEGCPLSRVAKPDVAGGIYRVRKKGAAAAEDPWGATLDLAALPPQALVGYIDDDRFAVRDRAAERLAEVGAPAVPPLRRLLRTAEDAGLRMRAVFALGRIGTPAAREGVRAGLRDADAGVRTAAARMAGLAGDAGALGRLMEMVERDAPAARRQAATALEQIGDRRAVPALLRGAAAPGDRFVRHAITHALITLGQPGALRAALEDASPDVRTTALVALDQMSGAPLRRRDVVPFLASDDARLRGAGVWVATHHPEWSDLVAGFVEARLDVPGRTDAGDAAVRDLLTAFCTEAPVQRLIGRRLADAGTPTRDRLLLLDVVDDCAAEPLPEAWIRQLGAALSQPEVRARALAVVASRGIADLEHAVARLANDPSVPDEARLDALDARIRVRPRLDDAEFAFLADRLAPGHGAPLRQRAARTLARADLSERQLLVLAREHLAGADLFLLPTLIDAFDGADARAVGEALVSALEQSPGRLDALSEQDLQDLLAGFPAPVRTSAEPLMETLRQRHADRLARLDALEARLGDGDVGAGRALFFGDALCSTCHAVGAEGSRFGPDLTNIGEIRSRHDLLEAILYPDASFAREYETYRVETRTDVHTGVIAEETPEALVVATGPASRVRLARDDVVAVDVHGVSMMPPGLHQQLTDDELSDLVAFLEALPYRIDRLIEARAQR